MLSSARAPVPRLVRVGSLGHSSRTSRRSMGMTFGAQPAEGNPSSADAGVVGGMGMIGHSARKERKEGDIGSVFASLSGESEQVLPGRFLDLKRSIIGDETSQKRLIASWETLTRRLGYLADDISVKQQECIPITTYEEFTQSPSPSLIEDIKRCGTVIIRDVVSKEQALRWLEQIREYIKLNPQVKGFPADDKQVFELYWSIPQLAARSHPRSLRVQKSLLHLFSTSDSKSSSASLTPLTYADRLRIRHPGDAKFALGPHMDGGSVERWEDPAYRQVYSKILSGDWEGFDAWEIDTRAKANQNMYDGAGACGVFRAFQGWTSLSDTGPNEGTLRVYPHLREQTAYTLLRPLFREKASVAELGLTAYLDASNWVLDTETSRFPGAPIARGQELNDQTHPHLQLDRCMVSIPRVKPGDQAWWHCDTIHAVESVHKGSGPSAVMYIPSVPLTENNVEYIRDQRESFLAGRPPPDFPGGTGESEFEGRGRKDDISGEGAVAMGLATLDLGDVSDPGRSGEDIRQRANTILGF